MDHHNATQIDATLMKMILSSIKDGNLNNIKNSLSKYSVDIRQLKDNDQNAYFSAALIQDDSEAYEVFKYFKEMGLDPFSKDKFDQTSLYYTAREGKYLCTKFLIDDCGLKINEKDLYGQNPIYYAVRENRIEVIKLLIERNSDINIDDKYGQSCIFYAVKHGHMEVIKLLIENGADVNKIDNKKLSLYLFAERNGRSDIAQFLLTQGAIKPEPKGEKDKKQKKIKQQVSEKSVSQYEQTPEDLQKPKKFILVKVTEDGQKIPLSDEEYAKFKNVHQDITMLLEKKDERDKLAESAPKDLIYYDSWEKQAKKLMNVLWKMKDAEIFHRPVNPIELGIPDYFTIIKHPMDFSTVKRKINNFHYTNCKEFCVDMDLVFTNCLLYNGENNAVGQMGINVRNEYNKQFNILGLDKFI